MNFYSLFLWVLLSVIGGQQKQFVKMVEEHIKIDSKGDLLTVTLPFKIEDGFHIQDVSDTKDNLIPTELTFHVGQAYEIISQEFSVPHYDLVILDQVKHRVLSNEFKVVIMLKKKSESKTSGSILSGELYYQTCNDRQCFFPRTLGFEVAL